MAETPRECDYLVIGAGEMGMCFVDTLLMEDHEITVVMVEKRPIVGGHWNDSYKFVTLHQPAAAYGVASERLEERIGDPHDMSSGPKIVEYFQRVQKKMEATGRVTIFTAHEFQGEAGPDLYTVSPIGGGKPFQIKARRKLVDASWLSPTVPAMRKAPYEVAEGMHVGPPNELFDMAEAQLKMATFIVVGGGKTGVDAVCFLLRNGTPKESIQWIVPNDCYWTNRSVLFHGATPPGDEEKWDAKGDPLHEAFLARGLLRLDPSITPTKYRCGTISHEELRLARSVKAIRMGRIKSIGKDSIVLEKGQISTNPGTFHVDCTANGLTKKDTVPIFSEKKIIIQSVVFCTYSMSPSATAKVELSFDSDEMKNSILTPMYHPEVPQDRDVNFPKFEQNLAKLSEHCPGFAVGSRLINPRNTAWAPDERSKPYATEAKTKAAVSKCPFAAMMAKTTWKPQKLNLKILSQPKYEHLNGDYAAAFKGLDLNAVKTDLKALLKNSQDWWPADYGHYGPFFIRLAWHSAGTYRVFDGRGGANSGNMRFDPHGSWPDNGNLDKARRLLWPIKKKYGKALSWGDLMILVGNVSLEDMGFKTLGFGGGRVDCWATEEDAYWGEMESFQGLTKAAGSLEKPLGAIQMELIYVNPEGPDGNPDPLLAAHHIRETFGRMAMNDEETVALIAGGHTFGKAHGAGPATNVGACPKDAPIEAQGFGWASTHGTGKGKDAITSGLEGAWTAKPAEWDHGYFHNLFAYEYELTTSPAGAKQWRPKNNGGADTVPDAHDPSKKHQPMMFTTDLSLKEDPAYLEISKRFHADPAYFAQAFAKAWYKLTHRDMGNVRRFLGGEVAPEQAWQDPVPKGTLIDDAAVTALKADLKASGLTPKQMVATAWASASTFRHTDFRGGANGGRVFLAPQKDWQVNDPAELKTVQAKYEEIQKKNGKVSMADLIVLGGCVGVEEAAKKAGFDKVQVPFASGRGDATQDMTDVQSFSYLEPLSDGFRNHDATPYQLVDRAHLLTLTVPEMTCLVGGMRAMGINSAKAGKLGLFSEEGKLNNEWFVTLLDMATEWKKGDALSVVNPLMAAESKTFRGVARGTTTVKFEATAVDLAFGSNPELRAVSEFYAMDDCGSRFVDDFVKVWAKVMDLDRVL